MRRREAGDPGVAVSVSSLASCRTSVRGAAASPGRRSARMREAIAPTLIEANGSANGFTIGMPMDIAPSVM